MDVSTLAKLEPDDRIAVELADSDEGFVGTVDEVDVASDHVGASMRVIIDDVVEPEEWGSSELEARSQDKPSGTRDGTTSTERSVARDWEQEAVLISSDGTMNKPEIKPARQGKTRPNPNDDVLGQVESLERDLGDVPDLNHN